MMPSRFVPWANLALLPVFALGCALITCELSSNGAVYLPYWHLMRITWFIFCWLLLVWISAHVTEITKRLALALVVVVLLWDVGIRPLLPASIGPMVEILGAPISIWFCFGFVVWINGSVLRKARLW